MFVRLAPILCILACGRTATASDLSFAVWIRAENDGVGSGFVVDHQRRWVVTCRHVLGEQKTVDVFFPWYRDDKLITDKNTYLGNRPLLRANGLLTTGTMLKMSDSADLALIELDSLPPASRAIAFAKSPAQSGDSLTVIGHRTDLETLWNLTSGPVRATGRLADGYHWRGKKLAVNADVLLAQLPIEEGDSGGPVLNARSELVGMVCAVRRQAPLAAIAIASTEIHAFLGDAAPGEQREPHPLAESLTRATVWVRPTATEYQRAGVVIDKNLILTSAKGLGQDHRVGVAFPLRDGQRWMHDRGMYRDPVGLHLRGLWHGGEVLARDPDRDLALIRVEAMPIDAQPIKLATRPTAPGDMVHAMNHPGGVELAWVYSTGVVRQRGRVKLNDGDAASAVDVHLFQLPSQAGSPGGPVVNANGELVGVLSAREGSQFVGYAAESGEIDAFLAKHRADTPPATLRGAHLGCERSLVLHRAILAINARNWRAARSELERILEPYPGDAEARRLLVPVLLGLHKDDEAATAVLDTLRADPTHWPIVARDLMAQADDLAKKYPDAPSAAANWLRNALTAVQRAPLDPAILARHSAALQRAATASTDKERHVILRDALAD